MKILVLAPPMGNTGGIQNYTTSLFRALVEILGEESVRMVAVPAEPQSLPDGTAALSPGVKLRFLLAAVGMAVRWRPQLVLCAHIGVAPAARLIQRLTGADFWVILYGIEVWGELSTSKLHALRRAQRLVGISRYTLQATIARHALSDCRTALLAPAFAFAQEQSAASSPPVPAGSDRPIILTVGRLAASERYKGHDVMLEAWPKVLHQVPNALYVVVGDGDDLSRLKARSRELGLTDSVSFRGAVSVAELQACYDSCRVFALPARTELDPHTPRGEGFGIVFLEAMAHGKPVVGPNAGAPAEFIHSGEHGLLVDPENPDEIAQALIELLRDPDRAQQMGRAARDWVHEQFSYNVFCSRLGEILEQALIH